MRSRVLATPVPSDLESESDVGAESLQDARLLGEKPGEAAPLAWLDPYLGVSTCLVFMLVVLACAPGLDDRLLQGAWGGLVGRLPVLFTWGMNDAVVAPKLCLWVLLLPPLLVVWTAKAKEVRGGTRVAPWWLLGLAAYFILLALSQSTSVEPVRGLEKIGIETCVAGFTLLLVLFGGQDALRAALRGLALAGVCNAVYALMQHFDLDLLAWSPPELVRERSIGTLGNPDFLASYLASTWLLCMGEALCARKTLVRLAWNLSGSLVLCALAYTYTRGAYLGCAAEFLAGVLLARRFAVSVQRQLGIELVRVVLTSVGLIALTHLALPRSESFGLVRRLHETLRPQDASTTVRLVLWREAGMICLARPWLGSGPGTFNEAMRVHRWVEPASLHDRLAVPNDPHNQWLATAAESGIPALLALLLLVLRPIALLRVASEECSVEVKEQGVRVLTGVALLGWVVCHAVVQATLVDWMLLWPLVLVLVRVPMGPSKQPVRTPQQWYLPAIGLGVVWCVLIPLALNLGRSETDLAGARTLGLAALREGGVEGAQALRSGCALYDRAAQFSPWWRLSQIYAQKARLLEAVCERLDQAAGTNETAADSPGEAKVLHQLAKESLWLSQAALRDQPLNPFLCADLARSSLAFAGHLPKGRERDSLVAAALQYSQRSVYLDPYNSALVADHARRCWTLGMSREALDAMRRAAGLSGRSALHREFAQMLQASGDRDGALYWLNTAEAEAVNETERVQARTALERIRGVPVP